ncbi:MAG: AmmeMemoRadiSam system protein B [Mangrovibacterium sp.]
MKSSGSMWYPVFILLSLSVAVRAQSRDNGRFARQPAVAGSFYPADPDQLKTRLQELFKPYVNVSPGKDVAALIVPHAGYVYSGKVAASAYARLDPEKKYPRIFLIGTSHHLLLEGASIYNKGHYRTPLGMVNVDTLVADRLIRDNPLFEYVPAAHAKEHSLEVQLPFLQYRLNHPFKIVPILIGTQSEKAIEQLAGALRPYFQEGDLFVISSDFSHYADDAGAREADKITREAILTNSPGKFLQALRKNEGKHIPGLATSCCGWSSVLTLLNLSSAEPGISVKHIRYMNSGDAEYGEKSRVVGYHAFAFERSSESAQTTGFSLTDAEKIQLLQMARSAIEARMLHHYLPDVDSAQLSERLKTPCGAFVTLEKKGKLRGCIGRFGEKEPLYRIVREMAVAAAFQDYRFDPLQFTELAEVDIEISVLTPLQRIETIDEFELGKHGIYIIQGERHGTFLPQVAANTGWTKEEFLGHCARDKAGLDWDGWKDAELYIYEALVFSEPELLHTEQ